jgi:MerR family transcriptional regulator, light-induced transcriptional regulator
MAPQARTMTLQQVADDLGVHYMTVYRYVRQGRLPATRHGTQWRIRAADLEAYRNTPRERRGAGRTGADREGLERRMLAGDSAGVWWLVESHLGGGLDPSGALTELIVPALRSIGDLWADGSVSIAEEHRATAVAQRVIGHLGLQFGRRGKDRGTVALTAPAGDLHTLPVAIVADLLRWRGFDVLELGADTPADELGSAVALESRLLAVGIVSTTPGQDDEMALATRTVRAAVPGTPIFVGGGAIHSEDQALDLGADIWTGSGANAAVNTVLRVAGLPEEQARRVA